MTIDVERLSHMPEGRHPCDAFAAHMERFYRVRPAIRHNVTLSLRLARPRSVSVVYIRTLHRRRGHGSIVMDEMARAADMHDVTLDLDARAVRDEGTEGPGLNQSALVAFYERRGFRIVSEGGGSATMRRLAPSLRRRS